MQLLVRNPAGWQDSRAGIIADVKTGRRDVLKANVWIIFLLAVKRAGALCACLTWCWMLQSVVAFVKRPWCYTIFNNDTNIM